MICTRRIRFIAKCQIAHYSKYDNSVFNDVKQFEEIPGPKSLPVLGTLYQYLPLIGKY